MGNSKQTSLGKDENRELDWLTTSPRAVNRLPKNSIGDLPAAAPRRLTRTLLRLPLDLPCRENIPHGGSYSLRGLTQASLLSRLPRCDYHHSRIAQGHRVPAVKPIVSGKLVANGVQIKQADAAPTNPAINTSLAKTTAGNVSVNATS